MVNSCCAVGCRSGYNDQDAPGNVTLHRFPKDPQNFQAWIRAISRKDWIPSKRSKLCSLYFESSDFVTNETRDSNSTRQKPKEHGGLQRKLLKKNAIPTKFPNLPHYYSKPKLIEGTGLLVFSETRWQRQLENLEVANAAFLESSKLTPTLVATALAWKSTS